MTSLTLSKPKQLSSVQHSIETTYLTLLRVLLKRHSPCFYSHYKYTVCTVVSDT